MKNVFRFIAVSLIVVASSAQAVKEYYSVSESVRALGMGGAYYGLSDDQYALFYNPAGLSLYRASESQIMFGLSGQFAPSTLSAISTITSNSGTASSVTNALATYAGKPLYAGIGIMPYYVKKNFAVGLLINDTKVDVAVLGRNLSSEVDLTMITDHGLVVGYGDSWFNKNLHLGANLKAIYRGGGRRTFTILDIAQNSDFDLDPQRIGGFGLGIDADLGAVYELDMLPFGVTNRVSMTLSNIMASKFSIARQYGAPPGLQRTLSLGYYTVFPGVSFIDNFHVVFDLSDFQIGGDNRDPHLGGRTGSLFKHINFGVEMPMNNWFSARLGFRQGYLTAGMGVWFKALRVDLATYGEEVGEQPGRLGSRRFALTIAVGGGSPAPAPMSKDTWEVPEAKKTPKIDVEKTERSTDSLTVPESDPTAPERSDVGGDSN